MPLNKPYLDIPGTTVFDADMARRGYHLNKFCKSLMKPENRKRFKADERAYLDDWKMTEEQKEAVIVRDFNRMLRLGGNINFMGKLFGADRITYQQAAAKMTGVTEDIYLKTMLSGGRSIAGTRQQGESGHG